MEKLEEMKQLVDKLCKKIYNRSKFKSFYYISIVNFPRKTKT